MTDMGLMIMSWLIKDHTRVIGQNKPNELLTSYIENIERSYRKLRDLEKKTPGSRKLSPSTIFKKIQVRASRG